jgi:hypothetical protein
MCPLLLCAVGAHSALNLSDTVPCHSPPPGKSCVRATCRTSESLIYCAVHCHGLTYRESIHNFASNRSNHVNWRSGKPCWSNHLLTLFSIWWNVVSGLHVRADPSTSVLWLAELTLSINLSLRYPVEQKEQVARTADLSTSGW